MRQEWEQKELGDVCKFQRGLTYSKRDEVELSSNCVLRANNVSLETGKLDLSELKYISDNIEVPENKKVKKGGLLICTASGSRCHLGKTALIKENENFIFGGFMGLLMPSSQLLPKFIQHFCRSRAYVDFISSLSEGTNINNLKWTQLKQIKIPLPPIEEQQRIVKILDEAFAELETARSNVAANLESSKELFRASIVSLFNSLKESDLIFKPLNEIAQIATGKRNANHACIDGKYRFYTCAEEYFFSNTKRFSGNCLILPGNGANVGKVFYYDGEFDAYQRTYVIYDIEISPKFLYYNLFAFWEKANRKKQYGSATNYIKIGNFHDYHVGVPSPSIQNRVVGDINTIHAEADRLQQEYTTQLADFDELRQSLLQKAFAGELT